MLLPVMANQDQVNAMLLEQIEELERKNRLLEKEIEVLELRIKLRELKKQTEQLELAITIVIAELFRLDPLNAEQTLIEKYHLSPEQAHACKVRFGRGDTDIDRVPDKDSEIAASCSSGPGGSALLPGSNGRLK